MAEPLAQNLKHFAEFKKILTSYQVPESVKLAIQDINLVLLVAPTSGGKNTIIGHQQKTGKYYYIISDTTRIPRVNNGVLEQNGVQYWFRTEEEVLADLRAGKYLEAELIHGQQVSGISIRELQKAKQAGKIAITDIDIEGVHNVLRAKKDTKAVMLLPPSYEKWKQRLNSRGRMSAIERRRRLQSAYKLLEDGLKLDYYHFVITENVNQSAGIIDSIAAGRINPHQDRGRALISQLLDSLQGETNLN